MKQSGLWKMAVDDKVRSLLTSESSQKDKDKEKDKKNKKYSFHPEKLYSLDHDQNGPSEVQVAKK